MGIGILYAMAKEADGLLKTLGGVLTETVAGIPFYALPGGHTLAVGGVGKVNAAMATQLLLDRCHPTLVLNAGCAGAFDPLPVGTVVAARHCVQHDVDTTLAGDPAGFVSTVERVEFPCHPLSPPGAVAGVVATGDWFGRDFDRAGAIRDTYGATVCDMEACAVAQVCLRNAVPFAALKAVSDHLLSPAQDVEYQENLPAAMEALDAAVAAVLQTMEG